MFENSVKEFLIYVAIESSSSSLSTNSSLSVFFASSLLAEVIPHEKK